MPLYEYQCEACGHRFEVIQKFSDSPLETCPQVRRRRAQAPLVAGDPVQGLRLVHHRLRARRESDAGKGDTARSEGGAARRRRASRRATPKPNRRPNRRLNRRATRRRPPRARAAVALPRRRRRRRDTARGRPLPQKSQTPRVMLDPALVRDNIDLVRQRLAARGVDLTTELEQLATLESQRRRRHSAGRRSEARAEHGGDEVARAKRQGLDAKPIFEANKMRAAAASSSWRSSSTRIEHQRGRLLVNIPNIPHESVPVGKSARRTTWSCAPGASRARSTSSPKRTGISAPALGIIDFERATKISGSRFAVLMGAGRAARTRADQLHAQPAHARARLHRSRAAVSRVNSSTLYGTGQLPKFEQDLFKIAGDWDLYLIPTAEVPVTNLYRGEILDGRQLPLQLHGLHAVLPQRGRLVRRRRARADSAASVRQGRAGEVHARPERRTTSSRGSPPTPSACCSCSGCRIGRCCCARAIWASRRRRPTTSRCGCRARRRIARSRPARTAKRSRRGARTSVSAATARARRSSCTRSTARAWRSAARWIAILENYQQADGSVVIPEALRPFMGGREVIAPR